MTTQKFPDPYEVESSVQRNLEAMAPDARELDSLLRIDPEEVMVCEAPLPEHRHRLMLVVKRAAEIVAPIAACRKGCSHCCKMAVTVTSYEAHLIGEAYGIKPATGIVTEMSQEVMVERYMNVPCSFLKQGVCQIYEHRPLPCRTHFNISDYPVLCDTVNHPGNDVPNIDFRPVWMADSILGFKSKLVFNDLREFFPEGLSPTESL